MILNKDIKPNKKMYYLGGKILGFLSSTAQESYDFLEIFNFIKKEEHITISLFILSLDWLYLLGAVKISQGAIAKCF